MNEFILLTGVTVIHDPFIVPHEYQACDIETRNVVTVKNAYCLKSGNKIIVGTDFFNRLKEELNEKTPN